MRGKLLPEIQSLVEERLGIASISTTELRLMPYAQYLTVNDMKLDPAKVTETERGILSQWRKRGWISGGASEEISFSKPFWDVVSECLWLAYANHGEVKDGD